MSFSTFATFLLLVYLLQVRCGTLGKYRPTQAALASDDRDSGGSNIGGQKPGSREMLLGLKLLKLIEKQHRCMMAGSANCRCVDLPGAGLVPPIGPPLVGVRPGGHGGGGIPGFIRPSIGGGFGEEFGDGDNGDSDAIFPGEIPINGGRVPSLVSETLKIK